MRFYCDLNMFANENDTLADGIASVSNGEESNELRMGKCQLFLTGMNHHSFLQVSLHFLMEMSHHSILKKS